MPPTKFQRFSDEPPSLAHLAVLARCISNPNCAENLDEEGNKLITPDASIWKETLMHLEDAGELIRRDTRPTQRPALSVLSRSAVISMPATFPGQERGFCEHDIHELACWVVLSCIENPVVVIRAVHGRCASG